MIPPLDGPAAYAAALGDRAAWGPAAVEVCRRHGLDPAGDLRMGRPGTYPVVLVGGRWAVKLWGPWQDGDAAADRELDAYDVLAAGAGLPVPGLVAEGELEPGWRYGVLTAVPGVPLREAWPALDGRRRLAVASRLGEAMAAVHALAVPAGLRRLRPGWDGYLVLLDRQRAGAVERHRRYGTLAPHLLEQLGEWLPPAAALVDRTPQAVLVHGDLRADHVLVDADGRPTGVIDWSDAVVGDPAYDFGPLLDAFPGDLALVGTYRAAAGLPPVDPRAALATALLHDFDQLGDAGITTAGARDLDDLAQRLFGGR